MPRVSNVLRAFAAGAFGGVANVISLLIIWQLVGGPSYSHAFLYRQVSWGGIWGLGFLVPALRGNWWLRGIVWGALATACALFVFRVVPVSPASVIVGLLVNCGAWGLTASWLYRRSGN